MVYNYDDIIEDFLNGKENTERNNHYTQRLFIYDKQLFSYGHHFLMAQFYKLKNGKKFLIVNSYGYSNTTQKQKYKLLSSYYGDKIFITNCDIYNTEKQKESNLREIEALQEKLKRQRKEETKERTLNEISSLKNQNEFLSEIIKEQFQERLIEAI